MARSSQTQQKRQRENKLREKAQLKRERRQQRQAEKKRSQSQDNLSLGQEPVSEEGADTADPAFEMTGEMTGAGTVTQAVDPYHHSANQPSSEGGGIVALKLFVGNLPRGVADQDLADFVTSVGFQVASAQVIRDRMTGDPKGFGFVELADGANLQEAVARLNGQTLQDRRLTVSEARPQRTGFSGSRGGSTFGGRGRDDFRRRDY